MEQTTLIVISSLVGGFSGGFFAFLFGRVGARIDRHRKRWKLHHDTLVRLESYCNDLFTLHPDNKLQFATIAKVCNATGNGPLYSWSQPIFIPLDPDLMNDLLCLETKNALFSIRLMIRRFNHAVETTVRAMSGLHSLYISEKIDKDVYRKNLKELGHELDPVFSYIDLIHESTVQLAAHVRVLLKKQQRSKFRLFLTSPKSPQVHADEVLEEVALLKSEFNEVAQRSIEELKAKGIQPQL